MTDCPRDIMMDSLSLSLDMYVQVFSFVNVRILAFPLSIAVKAIQLRNNSIYLNHSFRENSFCDDISCMLLVSEAIKMEFTKNRSTARANRMRTKWKTLVCLKMYKARPCVIIWSHYLFNRSSLLCNKPLYTLIIIVISTRETNIFLRIVISSCIQQKQAECFNIQPHNQIYDNW